MRKIYSFTKKKRKKKAWLNSEQFSSADVSPHSHASHAGVGLVDLRVAGGGGFRFYLFRYIIIYFALFWLIMNCSKLHYIWRLQSQSRAINSPSSSSFQNVRIFTPSSLMTTYYINPLRKLVSFVKQFIHRSAPREKNKTKKNKL